MYNFYKQVHNSSTEPSVAGSSPVGRTKGLKADKNCTKLEKY